MQLVTKTVNQTVFQHLHPGSIPGIAAGGYGIRIDNPGEEKFRAQWHQEFPGQLRSLDGIVFWTPLLPVTPDMGPVQIAEGSHAEGPDPGLPRRRRPWQKRRLRAVYGRRRGAPWQNTKTVAPLTQPGDLILMDFLTMHRGGHNVSAMRALEHPVPLFQFR